MSAGRVDRIGMERKWLQIRVLPIGEDTTPWLQDKRWIRSLRVVLDRLDEDQRRWVLALLSLQVGRGGISRLSEISHMDNDTFTKARRELAEDLKSCPRQRIRRAGAGRKPLTQTDPSLEDDLQQLFRNDIAGDPMSEKKWVRSSLRNLSKQLKEHGHRASTPVVSRLLTEMGFSMKANTKRKIRSNSPGRNEQFNYIALQRQIFTDAGLPIISVDAKKKELIGNFSNPGKTWCRQAEEVNQNDYPSAAICRATPYGIYDVTKNIQNELCNLSGLIVSVCQYPPGCSKWNPIEHRLFSQISINWAGKPLRTLDLMLGYIRGTTTQTGLTVKAYLQDGVYEKGQGVTKDEMEKLNITTHTTLPDWNYTISPQSN